MAEEGVNASIAGMNTASVQEMYEYIEKTLKIHFTPLITNLTETEPSNHTLPFRKLKVRIRDEIVKLGIDGIDPTCTSGTFVKPNDWNELISNSDTLTIDTRNIYEYHIGHFKGAMNPNTPNFTDFFQYANTNKEEFKQYKNLALYCTGGIRCEKASSMMIAKLQIEHTFQLQGGILKYFQQVPLHKSLWEGACFVFDDRIAVDNDMTPSTLQKHSLPDELRLEKDRSRHDGFIYSKIMSISQ